MASFLSDEWFSELNATLAAAGPPPLGQSAIARIVFVFDAAPTSTPHALTFTLEPERASVDAGDHLMADTVIRLPYDDALDLVGGSRDSAAALREGRIKIRGEVSTVTALLTWLQQAHPQRAS